mgnify:CR=1 FL=1
MKGIESVDRKVFHRIGEKNNCRLYTMGKLTENKGILSTNEEKGRNIPYLSTSYQQIVDKVKKGTVDLEEKY